MRTTTRTSPGAVAPLADAADGCTDECLGVRVANVVAGPDDLFGAFGSRETAQRFGLRIRVRMAEQADDPNLRIDVLEVFSGDIRTVESRDWLDPKPPRRDRSRRRYSR